jgi:hypothetical protein
LVCFYAINRTILNQTPPYAIAGRVIDLSNNDFITLTESVINYSTLNLNTFGICKLSATLYLIAYMTSSTQVYVVAAQVSNTSVTFGTPVSFSVSSGATLNPDNSYQNEMFQKLSDTEAVLIVSGTDITLTFAYIKTNGTTLEVTTSTQSSGGTHSLIMTGKRKIYYHFLSGSLSHANRAIYSLKLRDNELEFHRVPTLRTVGRPIKINNDLFIVQSIDVVTGPEDETNRRTLLVSIGEETEKVFPVFCRLDVPFWTENLTDQKTAIYGKSLPSGKILHYLVEGVF